MGVPTVAEERREPALWARLAKVVVNHEVEAGELIGDAAGLSGTRSGLDAVDQIDGHD